MTARDLIDAFETMADAPNGVEQLRSLVLDLAFSGRLVGQDPTKKGSELLERVKAEQEAIATQGRGNRLRKVSDIDGLSPNLPAHWAEARLGSLGLVFSGNSISAAKKRTIYSKVKSGYPYIATKDVGYRKDEISYDNGVRIPFDTIEFQIAHSQSVLICSEGGSAGRKMGMPQQDVCFGNKLIAIETFQGISAHFIHYYYMTTRFQREFEARKTGIIGGIAIGKFVDILVPIPPEEEQYRIVAKVDELMSLLDRLEDARDSRDTTRASLRDAALQALQDAEDAEAVQAAWSRISENMDELFVDPADVEPLRQTVLQLAVRGRLGTQDSADEHASILLGKIASNKSHLVKTKAIRKPKAIEELSEGDLPFTLPAGWEWSRLNDLVYSLGDGPHFSPKYVDEASGVPFLSARNVTIKGYNPVSMKYVSSADHEGFCRRIRPEPGDVLYTKGGTTGVAMVNELGFEFSVWVHVAVLKVAKEYLDSQYVALALNSPHCYGQSQQYTHGTGNRDLGLTRMIKITVPVPPREEQVRIVTKVKELMGYCDELEDRLVRAHSTSSVFASRAMSSLVS